MQQVTIHEMLHDMARDEKVKGELFNLVLDKIKQEMDIVMLDVI